MQIAKIINAGGDAAAAVLAVATLAKALPAIAATLSIVWTGLRIYESRTVQSLLGRPPRPHREDEA